MDRQLFSFDPKQHPRYACPHCGWQTFWQFPGRHPHLGIQCERCREYIREADLVEPK